MSDVLKADEVAGLLRISTWLVYDLTRRGELPHFCVGRCKRYIKADILEWAKLSSRDFP